MTKKTKYCWDTSVFIAWLKREANAPLADIDDKSRQRAIKTPDAQIIATAIIHGADVLHSLEPRHHALSGTTTVDGLKIGMPCAITGQKVLELNLEPSP